MKEYANSERSCIQFPQRRANGETSRRARSGLSGVQIRRPDFPFISPYHYTSRLDTTRERM